MPGIGSQMTSDEQKVIDAAKEIASMRAPSVESLLRRNGYNYEADKIAALVAAVNKVAPLYDAYEIHPCASLGIDEDGFENVETCDRDNPNICCWSVYGHLPDGGLDCLSDHETEEEAIKALALLNPPLG